MGPKWYSLCLFVSTLGQPAMLSQSAVLQLQTPGILPAPSPVIAVTGGLTPLPGHTVSVLPRTTEKSLANGNVAEVKLVHPTVPNTSMDVSSLCFVIMAFAVNVSFQ